MLSSEEFDDFEDEEQLFSLARAYIRNGDYTRAARLLFTGKPNSRGRPSREEIEFRELLEELGRVKTLRDVGISLEPEGVREGTTTASSSRTEFRPGRSLFRMSLSEFLDRFDTAAGRGLEEAVERSVRIALPVLLLAAGEFLAEHTVKFYKIGKHWNVTFSEPPEKAEKVIPWPPLLKLSIDVLGLTAMTLSTLIQALDRWQDVGSDAANLVKKTPTGPGMILNLLDIIEQGKKLIGGW